MKLAKFLTTTLIVLTTASLFAQKMSSAEKAIKEVIENETKFYNARNFDAWANTWVHAPGIYWSVTGPETSMSAQGWDALAQQARDYFKQNPEPNTYTPNKTDYQFMVEGNMAFVTFMENGNMSTRVLTKDKGDWRLMRMGVVLTGAYDHFNQKRTLQRLVGTWKLDPATVQLNDDSWTLHGLKCKVKQTDMGMWMYVSSEWSNNQGMHGIWKDEYMIAYDNASQSYGVMLNGVSPESSSVWSGKCHFKDGAVTFKTTSLGGEEVGMLKHKIMPEGSNK
ncbi:MAG: hypothetical protein R3330_02805, partial [Saprospiraceae bacterium]|nr:hypothetical protein [Saprospiraceae bacterium]